MVNGDVIIIKEFEHKYQPGSKLFLSSDNNILLEFTKDLINIYIIKNDNHTNFLEEIKRPLGLSAPVYFSDDFKQVIQFKLPGDNKKKQAQ